MLFKSFHKFNLINNIIIQVNLSENKLSVYNSEPKSNKNPLDLIIDIKKEIKRLISKEGRISDSKLSELLSQATNHIKSIKKYAGNNDQYQILKETLDSWRDNLIKAYKNKSHNVIKIITDYYNENKQEINNRMHKVLKYHPDIKLNYFKNIDTKEKAYWLGWLYAEGWLSQQGDIIRFGIEISKDDEILIDRFIKTIGFNPKYKEYNDERKSVKIRFSNGLFTNILVEKGFLIGKEKSKKIEFPEFMSREIYLSFLLGYFDGDGKQGTSKICSGSKIFLAQIKNHFNLNTHISPSRKNDDNFELALSAELFNEMLENYTNSLSRKKIRLETNEERIERLREFAAKTKKFKLTKEQLQNLIQTMKQSEIAEKYNYSQSTISYWCRKWGIKKKNDSASD